MKKILPIFILVILVFSCKKKPQLALPTISINSFPIEKVSIRAILPKSKDTVFYAGSNGQIGYTFNSGKTWHSQSIRYQDSIYPEFRSIATNTKDIFVLSVGNPALLYKLSGQKVQRVYKEEDQRVFYDAMCFFDTDKGMAMGDPTAADCLSVITTKDGGLSWQKKSCTDLPKTYKDEAAFAASNTNIKSIDNTVWMVTGGSKARVYKSSNKGVTWQVVDTPIIQGNGSQGIYSVDFYDEQNGIIIGGDYSNPKGNKQNKAITKDGGQTWTLVSDGQDPNYRSCVQYIPNTEGQGVIAVGKMGISISNNGGVTWQKVNTKAYYTIRFVDKYTAWLGGNESLGLMHLTY